MLFKKEKQKKCHGKASSLNEKVNLSPVLYFLSLSRHFRSFGGGTEVGADLNNPATKNINVSCGLISNKL